MALHRCRQHLNHLASQLRAVTHQKERQLQLHGLVVVRHRRRPERRARAERVVD